MSTKTLKKRPRNWVFRKEVSKRAVIYGIETPPGKYPLAFRDTVGGDGWDLVNESEDAEPVRHLNVFFPRLLWVVPILNGQIYNLHVFWIEDSFKKKKMATKLYSPPVPNTDSDGGMCYGNFKPGSKDEVEIVNNLMEHIFNSVWTSDLEPFYDVLSNSNMKSVREWHERSRKRKTNCWKIENAMESLRRRNFREFVEHTTRRLRQ